MRHRSPTRPCKARAGIVLFMSAPRAVFYNKNMNRFVNYVRDTRGELSHVSWPTRAQAIAFTVIVIAVSVAVSVYLGFFDYVLTLVLQKFVL